MITFNDAIKDKTQTTDEKIVEYGQKVNQWLTAELEKIALNFGQDFINGLNTIDEIIRNPEINPDAFDAIFDIVKNDDVGIRYVKSTKMSIIEYRYSLPDEIFQLLKIGTYINPSLFKDQLKAIPLVVKDSDKIIINTVFDFYDVDAYSSRVTITLYENLYY